MGLSTDYSYAPELLPPPEVLTPVVDASDGTEENARANAAGDTESVSRYASNFASNKSLDQDPHVAPMTAHTPPPRIHAGTAAVGSVGNDSTHVDSGTDSASMAFHGLKNQHPRIASDPRRPGEEKLDPNPAADIRKSKELGAKDKLRVGDVLVLAEHPNKNGQIDAKSKIVDTAVVVEVNKEGQAVRLAAKTDGARYEPIPAETRETIDFHPGQLPTRDSNTVHAWFRPKETDKARGERVDSIASDLSKPVVQNATDLQRFPERDESY